MNVRVCIAGGGPAGMMLGFLLARAGIEVAVLEKHADFLRDFRGDTIHPSTLELMHELKLLDEFLALPHSEVRDFAGVVDGIRYPFVDLRHVPTHCKFVAFMPQWDFLNFLAERAGRYSSFHLLMRTEARELLTTGGKVRGVRAAAPQGELEIHADLTVGADGRTSILRHAAAMPAIDFGAPMDVLWFRVPRSPGDPGQVLGYIKNGTLFVMLMRGTYWQCAQVIPKGSFEQLQAAGIESFRQRLRDQVPFLGDRAGAVKGWDDVKLLTVQVDRLKKWYADGLLFIGDAAHAMSPVGGVGINLAIQDAVAAANLLYPALASHREPDLAAVQRRREFPTTATQAVQLFIQRAFISKFLQPPAAGARQKPPLFMRAFAAFPILRRIPARIIGLGVRPEHVHTPEFIAP